MSNQRTEREDRELRAQIIIAHMVTQQMERQIDATFHKTSVRWGLSDEPATPEILAAETEPDVETRYGAIIRSLVIELGDDGEQLASDKALLDEFVVLDPVSRISRIMTLKKQFSDLRSDTTPPVAASDPALEEIERQRKVAEARHAAHSANAAQRAMLRGEFVKDVMAKHNDPEIQQSVIDAYDRALFEGEK